MRRWLYVAGMSLALLGAFVLATAAISKSSQADNNKQRAAAQKEKPAAAAEQSFDIKVTPWGPTQEEIDERIGNLTKDPSVDRLLSNTQNRLISLEFIDPDDKSGAGQSAPDRFRATFYDYTNERSVFAVGNFSKEGALEVTKSFYQPLPSPEEFDAAVQILQRHPQLGQLVTDKKLNPYQPMPPLYFAPQATGRVERAINIGLRANNTGNGAERENEVVAVNLGRQTVKRFANGAPPTSSAAPAADCTPPSSSGSSTGRGVAGQNQFTISAQDGSPLWSFIAIRPSASSGSDGSAIELVDVKYKDKLVLKRAHVPILNVLYDSNTCGPYRDWQYAENTFNADPTSGTTVAPGVRSCTVPATTILESNVDAGNHQGIAYYTEGDAVVLVTELSAGWYRYISEYRFHADGTIQPRFGMGAVQNGCTCNGHLHHVYWRFDFDIDSAAPNRILETRGRDFNAFAVPFEGKRYRSKTRQSWIVDNSKTGDAWTITSNDNDGTATGDAYGRGDLWFLSYSATEFEDSSVRGSNTQANLDAIVTNQKLNNADVVVWYGAHINHNRGMFNRYHDHSISGPLVGGPDLKPLRW